MESKNFPRKFLMGLIAIVTGVSTVAFGALSQADNGYTSLWSTQTAPVFYGTTAMTLQQGTAFNPQDARMRIFARDFQDGDLTKNINIVSNTVDTSKPGEYIITYSVKDSNNHTATKEVPVTVVNDDSGNYYEKTLYTLPDLSYMNITGSRGNEMDRQVLGFMLKSGQAVEVQQVSGTSTKVSLYGSDGSLARQVGLSTTAQNLGTSSAVSSLIAETPKTGYGASAVIGIRVPASADMVELPYYHYGDDESTFRSHWQSLRSAGPTVGAIENQSALFYLTTNDQPSGYSALTGTFDKIDSLMQTYDSLSGYDYNAKASWNQNVKTKYFIRGGGNCSGFANYTSGALIICGSSTPSSSAFGINFNTANAIARGYQASGLNEDGGMALGAVSPNILTHYAESHSVLSGNYLGNIADIETAINEKRLAGTTFRTLSEKEKLYVIVNYLETFNYDTTYAELARLTREMSSKGTLGSYSLADRYTLAMYNANGANGSAYWEAWGESISASVKDSVKGGKTLSILKDVAGDDAAAIKADLKKSGLYSLVTSEQLAAYNLKGNLKVKVNIDNHDQLKGKKITFASSGHNYELAITGAEQSIELPIGSYIVTAPRPNDNLYQYTAQSSIQIKKGDSEITINYSRTTSEQACNYNIILHGQNSTFAEIRLNYGNKKIKIIGTGAFLSASQFEPYAKVEIIDKDNNSKFTKSWNSNNNNSDTSSDEVSFEPGDRIEIYHQEGAGHITIKHPLTGMDVLGSQNGNNTYYIGNRGLYQLAADAEQKDQSTGTLKAAIDKYAMSLSEKYDQKTLYNPNSLTDERRILLASINALPDSSKNTYLEKYHDLCFGKENYNGDEENKPNQPGAYEPDAPDRDEFTIIAKNPNNNAANKKPFADQTDDTILAVTATTRALADNTNEKINSASISDPLNDPEASDIENSNSALDPAPYIIVATIVIAAVAGAVYMWVREK